jgi:uncharacterized damage-inducible protein DinB
MQMTDAPIRTVESPTKAALVRALANQREHILAAVEGLTDAQLREPMLQSGWTLLGLVNHLALDVENYWFVRIVGGAPLEPEDGPDLTDAWHPDAQESASAILERYRTEAKAADAVIATADLDAAPAQRDSWWGTWDVPDVRFVLLHVITETAAHAGHADAVRELIDGSQYIVL